MSFEELLVIHASPTLANMKPASLVCLNELEGKVCSISELEARGLSFFSIVNRKGCRLVLVYRKEKLEMALQNVLSQEILRHFGYSGTLKEMLEHLSTRFLSEQCPHEVGIFLGYPPEDVQAFIQNNGKNAVSSDFWKIYFNVEQAEITLRKWKKCRKKYIECFLGGTDITRLCVTA